MSGRIGVRLLLLLALAAVILIAPLYATGYQRSLMNLYLLYVILATSFDMLRGNTGYVNLGHTAVFGWSAYFFAILVKNGYSLLPSAASAALLSLALGMGVGAAFFKTRGAYYTIITLGFSLLSYSLAYSMDWVTGGWEGISVGLGEMHLTAFYGLFPLASSTLLTSYLVSRSSLGLSLKTMRESEEAAESLGLNTYTLKLKALAVSSVFPAVAGPLYVLYSSYVNPDTVFGLKNIFAPATMALFGGSGTVLGPVMGAILITTAFEILFTSQLPVRLTIIGALLVLVGLFMPRGLVGLAPLRRRRPVP
ncbi:MAG: branched-chain amino acid ABC transporter permease [Candidatus Caldarchaeum sp.]